MQEVDERPEDPDALEDLQFRLACYRHSAPASRVDRRQAAVHLRLGGLIGCSEMQALIEATVGVLSQIGRAHV